MSSTISLRDNRRTTALATTVVKRTMTFSRHGLPGATSYVGNMGYLYNLVTGLWHRITADGPDGNVTPLLEQIGVVSPVDLGGTVIQTTAIGIPNIAALRIVANPVGNQVVKVLGFAAPGDGGGGDWYYDANSYAVDDGTLVVRPTAVLVSSPGRWIKL